jgi:hypothetical protein
MAFSSPPVNILSNPQLAPSAAKVNHGTRHVRIAPLIQGNGVSMRQAQNLGHALSINQLTWLDASPH